MKAKKKKIDKTSPKDLGVALTEHMSTVSAQADTYVRATHRLRAPASRALYVPEAQGEVTSGLLPAPHAPCVLGTRASPGRTVRMSFRGYHPR